MCVSHMSVVAFYPLSHRTHSALTPFRYIFSALLAPGRHQEAAA